MASTSSLAPRPASGRLIVCPTPIGHWGDLSARALDALRSADVIACEDTRRAKNLLGHLDIGKPLVSLHEHNEAQRVPGLVERIVAGEAVVLISDAGTPAINDPGYLLIRAVIEHDLELNVLPGPSAVITAVVASGLPLDGWSFIGFLPRKRGALTTALSAPRALVAFESPRRLVQTLEVLDALDSARRVAVCRELTKTYEEIIRGPAAKVLAHFRDAAPLGEIVLVISPGSAENSLGPALEAVRMLVEAGAHARAAVAVVANLEGLSRNVLYAAWLRERA